MVYVPPDRTLSAYDLVLSKRVERTKGGEKRRKERGNWRRRRRTRRRRRKRRRKKESNLTKDLESTTNL
jgi:hypothetical protein